MGEGLIKCRSCSSAACALHPPACGAACSKESGAKQKQMRSSSSPPCAVVNFGAKSPLHFSMISSHFQGVMCARVLDECPTHKHAQNARTRTRARTHTNKHP
jgi:hypothetical protein